MSKNDYIAEYIKERRPEIIHSLDFIMWKLVKTFLNELVNADQNVPLEELRELCGKENEDEDEHN